MKINSLTIQTPDISKTEHFYANVLGFNIVTKSDTSVSFQIGDTLLECILVENQDPIYHLAFNIPRNQLQEAIEWMSNKLQLLTIGEDEVVTEFNDWNAKAIYFFDDTGNLLECIARQDLQNNTETPFSIHSILNISEIGIINEQPLLLANTLFEKHNISLFDKNKNSNDFATIGDDDGLLVVVKPNRNWYPTQIPAKQFFTKIKIQNNDVITDLVFE